MMAEDKKKLSEYERIVILEDAVNQLKVHLMDHSKSNSRDELYASRPYVTHNYAFAGAEDFKSRGSCIYKDKEYSSGAVVCQAGKKYVCTSGTWTKVSPEEIC